MDAPNVSTCVITPEREALVHDILGRIADKWTLLVIDALEGQEAVRFSALRQRVGGVSQKMLTKTLRQLERDGVVARQIYPVVPPRVEYRLTPLGESLGEAVCSIWIWAGDNIASVEEARRAYDGGATGK